MALAQELARAPAPAHVPALLELLADPEAREPAREALGAIGAPALDALTAALRDSSRPHRIRRHVPRSISRFAPERAIPLLVEALGAERDPHVRYKILRGLGRLRADRPAVPLAVGRVLAVAESSLRRAIDVLAFQTAVAPTAGGADDLLLRLLREKEWRALERVFRALHIVDPELGYRALSESLRDGDPGAVAAACEVLEHLAKEPLRSGLLPLVAPGSPAERLRAALAFHQPPGAAALLDEPGEVPGELWAALERDDDPVLAALARRARAEREGRPHGER
jgi:HEAT repeat protein